MSGRLLSPGGPADPAPWSQSRSRFCAPAPRGDLVIQGSDVILFGEGFAEHSVVVDGNVEVRGTNVRIRGVTITGDLVVFGNSFGMSFSVVEGQTQLNGQAISFLRNVFCSGATVPSSNAALFDNLGLPPFPAPPAPDCP